MGDFNPLANLYPKTLYAPSNWPDYLAAATAPPPRKQQHQMAKPAPPKEPERPPGPLVIDMTPKERAAAIVEGRKHFPRRAN